MDREEKEGAGAPRLRSGRTEGDAPSPEATAHEGAPSDEAVRCPFCGSAAGGEGVRIGPNKHRELQVRRLGGRVLFDDARKETFLQWFALTANVSFAAEQAGVCRQTVSKHRLSDAGFAERYLEALSLAVPDLQARLIAYLQGRPKLSVAGELEPPDDADFDPQLALQILRELSKMDASGKAGTPLKPGRRPRVATDEEVEAALVKRLAAFQARMRAGEDSRPSAEPVDGPPPPQGASGEGA